MTDSDSILLAEASGICPTCNREFRTLSRHWAHVEDHRPPIAPHQHEVLAGLVLGGATIYTQAANPVCQFRTQYRDFAVWVTEALGWLVRSLRRVPTPSEAETAMQSYQVRTFPHPELDRYTGWLTNECLPSTPLPLTDRTVRVWYAKAAFVAWSRTHNTRETGFSAKHDPKQTWVGTLLRQLDLSPSYRRYSWFCSPRDSRALLNRVGEPVPGVEHKWSFDHDEYQAIRQEQHAARAWLADHPDRERQLTIERYAPGEYDPAPIATEWAVETVYRPLGTQYSDGDCLDALQAVGDALDEPVTVTAYEQVRERVPSLPSSSLLQQRFGTWATALTAAGID